MSIFRMENNESNLNRFDELEQSLEVFIENARHLCVIAADFQPSTGQNVLNQKLQALVNALQELDQSKGKFQDVKVPIELIDYVESGKNPQLYAKDCIERTLQRNKEVNGKIELYKKFRASLLKEMTEEFPKETMQYRAIREYGDSSTSRSYGDK
ncbi:unnamed protein product [Soboliphyme baturini]|uniref:Mediator of RNA polymerase II transcription subunit 10 n=1 Tax=Soboliphyme baturini TaxID=241478 RepID=A0A183J8C0_9BILA|nr:unnamed protein product [Soboliphyme baturini]